jgi:hypothetical protein
MEQYNFVKKIIKRRRLERQVRRDGERMDESLRSRRLRTRDEERQFLDADKGWMVKVMCSWRYTVLHFDQTREGIGSSPWHGENPAECDITGLSVCCKLTEYHKGPYQGPRYPLWWTGNSMKNPIKPIDELMRDGHVFSDGSHQVWVQLTEEEFKDSFFGFGKHRDETIVKYVMKDLLKWVDPRTPQVSRMFPFRAYRQQCAVAGEDISEDPNLDLDPDLDTFLTDDNGISEGTDDDGMSKGGNRTQKKHKHKHKTKTKTKSKPKTKSKSKTKPKPKSKTKTKSKNRVQHFQRLPQSMQVTKVVMGSSADRVCS